MKLKFAGMNAAVRAIVRMGIYVGCKVYLIKEVSKKVTHCTVQELQLKEVYYYYFLFISRVTRAWLMEGPTLSLLTGRLFPISFRRLFHLLLSFSALMVALIMQSELKFLSNISKTLNISNKPKDDLRMLT